MLVVTNSNQLYEQRRQFERQMGNLIVMVNEQTSCRHAIADSLAELKVLRSFIDYAITALFDTTTANATITNTRDQQYSKACRLSRHGICCLPQKM